MYKVFSIFLFALVGMMISCTTISTLTIDQMMPADMSFPAEIRNVAVVNNLPFPPNRWPDKYTLEDTHKIIEGDGQKAIEVLAQCIADGNYFERVVVCDSALKEKNPNGRSLSSLNQDEIKELSDQLGVDMIISLDAVMIKTKIDLDISYETQEITNLVNATVSTLIRLYVPSHKKTLATLTDQDSIYWYAPLSIDQEVVLEEASNFAGSLPVKHLIPEWTTVRRYYYTGGLSDLRDATFLIKQGNWEEALASWQKLYHSGGKKKQKYAAFNMALYYEMQNDFDEAEKWIKQSIALLADSEKVSGDESIEYILMRGYLAELEKRRDEVQKLNVQMDRFQPQK